MEPKLKINSAGYWFTSVRHAKKQHHKTFGNAKNTTRARAMIHMNTWWETLLAANSDSPANPSGNTVETVVQAYLNYADTYYLRKDGTPTGTASELLYGLQPLVDLFADLAMSALRPSHIKAFIAQQIQAKIARTTINKRIFMVRRLLSWAVTEELLVDSVARTCERVPTIRRGSSGVKEPKKVRAVPLEAVRQTTPFLPATVLDMVELQLLTAMRPGEVCVMRGRDVTTAKEGMPWTYTPAHYKTEHRKADDDVEEGRVVFLGPLAIAIVSRRMQERSIDAYLFSPRDAMQERSGYSLDVHGARYTTHGYQKAIAYACRRAFPAPVGMPAKEVKGWDKKHRWTPNQIRKLALDLVTVTHGKQGAKAMAGHSRVETTQEYYLSQDRDAASAIAMGQKNVLKVG